MPSLTHKQKALIERAAQRQNQTLGFKPSMMHDLFLWIEHDGFDKFVQKVVSDIEAREKRKRRSSDTSIKFQFAVKSFLLNLLKVERCPHRTELAVQKAAGAYTFDNRYDQRLAAHRPMMDAYDGLLELSYFRVATPGYWNKETNKGKVTRIEPTSKLKQALKKIFPQQLVLFTRHPNEETIKLKSEKDENKEKHYVYYTDDSFTDKARGNLAIINKWLNSYWYDLYMPDADFTKLDKQMVSRSKKDPSKTHAVDFSARSLYRVFNDGSFEKGGRLYGGWWEMIPSEYRQYITINRDATVEVDFSGFHPFMLYALEKIVFEGDAYEIDGVEDKYRSMVKIAFTKLLNGKHHLKEPDDYDDTKVGMSWKELLKAVEKKHQPIRKYFRTGYGLELMNRDSAIAERVMLACLKRGYPCLPVHDSFIVRHDLDDELQEIMLDEYHREFGTEGIGFKTKDGLKALIRRNKERAEKWVAGVSEEESYSQYEERWSQWLQYKDTGI